MPISSSINLCNEGFTFKQMVQAPISSPNHQPVLMSHNPKQIKNVQASQKQLLHLTHDVLYNLHRLAYDLDDFAHM